MTKVFRGHFDGSVLVPEQPVDLPIGRSMEVRIDDLTPPGTSNSTAEALLAAVRAGPRVTQEDTAELDRAIAERKVTQSVESLIG